MCGAEFDKIHLSSEKRVEAEGWLTECPGGSSIPWMLHLVRERTCMPHMFIKHRNVVAKETMIDSHALVGSLRTGGRSLAISLRRRRSAAFWSRWRNAGDH